MYNLCGSITFEQPILMSKILRYIIDQTVRICLSANLATIVKGAGTATLLSYLQCEMNGNPFTDVNLFRVIISNEVVFPFKLH